MNRFEDSELELGPEVRPGERDVLIALIERLERERPLPAAGFRGELRRRLLGGPQRLRALVGAYAGSGFALLALATLGVGGVGPLSAG